MLHPPQIPVELLQSIGIDGLVRSGIPNLNYYTNPTLKLADSQRDRSYGRCKVKATIFSQMGPA